MLIHEVFEYEMKKSKLDYLVEYLVVAESISNNEAVQLINLLEDVKAEVKSKFDPAIKNVKRTYGAAIEKATEKLKNANGQQARLQAKAELEKLTTKYKITLDKLEAAKKKAMGEVVKAQKLVKAKLKAKEIADTGKKIVGKMGTKGKVAAGVALGTAAAGGGYMAYRARQKKLAAAKA